ncbi:hypothetical protein D3C71_1599290 [compost metagenome]
MREASQVGRPRRHANQQARRVHVTRRGLQVAQPILQGQHPQRCVSGRRVQQRRHAAQGGIGVQAFGEQDEQVGHVAVVLGPQHCQAMNAPISAIGFQPQALGAYGVQVRVIHIQQGDVLATFT